MVDKLVLDGSVESFQMGVGLRVSGVIEEVNEAIVPTIRLRRIEVFVELAAVIGLDSGSGEWSDRDELIEEVAAVG